MQERWHSLSPEERQIFQRNAERWMRMTPEERTLMRQREKVHRQKLKGEADAILRQSGLHLNADKQARFEQRYIQERRKIEHALNQEIEAKRKQELPALNERLKKEFQKPSGATAHGSTPTPAASARATQHR
jgi:TRAP-type C4-dicarboxylate transport system substrate-binding protein